MSQYILRKIFPVFFISTALLFIFFYSDALRTPHIYTPISRPSILPHKCTPAAYSAGNWQRKQHPFPLSSKEGVLAASGFEGCASTREVGWHLGRDWNDNDAEHKLEWRRNASAYTWVPSEQCADYTAVNREELVRQLVEEGGWLLLGDSITEGHFFSLSCMLYPHVRATPDYTQHSGFDRAWPQNLYLAHDSPLRSRLAFPDGFEIDTTPLVTFRRVDLLLGKPDLTALYAALTPAPPDSPAPDPTNISTLFSSEAAWDLDPASYLPLFFTPLPAANYRAMIMSTGGHWTTTLFEAFRDESLSGKWGGGGGMERLVEFFGEAMGLWASTVMEAVEERRKAEEREWKAHTHAQGISGSDTASSRRARPPKSRQVLVRAYTPGHDGCHNAEIESEGPVKREGYSYPGRASYNWAWIGALNAAFENVVTRFDHPNVYFLNIDTPAILRPEGHVNGDCLHLLTGGGVLEGWTEYISYFLSRLP